MVQSASYLTDMLLQSLLLTSMLTSLQQNALYKPLSNPKEHKRKGCEWGNTGCAPQRHLKFLRERSKEGKLRLLLPYQMSVARYSNSCFQLLLKPEIRPHTIPRSSTTVAACTLLRTGNTHMSWMQLLPGGTLGSYREPSVSASSRSHLCSQQCLREAKVHPGSPHLSRLLVHTHCSSGCSFSPLTSLTQRAPSRFEKLPHVPASLPQVQRQMSRTNLFTG